MIKTPFFGRFLPIFCPVSELGPFFYISPLFISQLLSIIFSKSVQKCIVWSCLAKWEAPTGGVAVLELLANHLGLANTQGGLPQLHPIDYCPNQIAFSADILGQQLNRSDSYPHCQMENLFFCSFQGGLPPHRQRRYLPSMKVKWVLRVSRTTVPFFVLELLLPLGAQMKRSCSHFKVNIISKMQCIGGICFYKCDASQISKQILLRSSNTDLWCQHSVLQ